jgi:hypothetical protein
VILQDGELIGIWDIILKPEPTCKLHFFEEIGNQVQKRETRIAKELAYLITGKDLEIKSCESMVPLTEKSMEGFLSPLGKS